MLSSRLSIAIACLFMCTTASAQVEAPLPPVLPWSGASEKLIAKPGNPWITPIEQSGFEASPRYAEVRAWLERLDEASPLVRLQTFGRSEQRRDLLFVRASKGDAVKPVVLIQAGIHAGEIDGKDAGLMLLRDIAVGGKDSLLDEVDFVFVPILNIDGHERMNAWSRPHQRGPVEKGYRSNARNININRDYAKLDAPETRAIVSLLRDLDPALYVDMHVSDGFDHQYDVTFTYAGWGRYARNRNTADWLEQSFTPAVEKALAKAGHIPGVYPSAIDARDPSKGIRFSPEGPRYSTGYGDFIGVPTVLVENHSLKPYRQRVLGAYVLMEEALKLVGRDAPRIAAAKAADRARRHETLMTRWTPRAEPIGWLDFKGVAYDMVASPASGRMEQRWLGTPRRMGMPIIGQEPTETVKLPKAWWVPVEQKAVIERLTLHGIRFETMAALRTLRLDRARLVDPKPLRPSDGRYPIESSFAHEQADFDLPAGSVRVPADQPLGLLAASLLEPESQDSFLAWGFFPELMSSPADSEDFVIAPMAERMLAADPALKQAFEAKLSADPAFAADPDGRLAWFYERSPYRDPYHLLYPIGREVE